MKVILPVHEKRVSRLNDLPLKKGPVIYWMSRDQRVNDNWALLYAQELALQNKAPLVVVFCLLPRFLGATLRHYSFMMQGLSEIESSLSRLKISFFLITGEPEHKIEGFCRQVQAGALVSDFNPLRINQNWKLGLLEKLPIAFFEVDAHNIVPCRAASPKQEYAAYTFRPKIKKLLPEYLTDIPAVKKHPFSLSQKTEAVNWQAVFESLEADRQVGAVSNFKAGEEAAREQARLFIDHKLARYDQERNDPNLDGQSNLSPYLHFGQLGAQRLALMVKEAEQDKGVSADAFLEELIVRRELADNYCFYNDRYDSTEAFPRWARESLAQHAGDRREYLYSREEFEGAATHDRLWNAAQQEMVIKGKMHGYMRMYWAKKILEWTESADQAMEIAVYLNDKYSLDGRDPNGYAGIAWSIGGVHDRAWPQRPVFGKIRYMSFRGSKSKFKVEKYIEAIDSLRH